MVYQLHFRGMKCSVHNLAVVDCKYDCQKLKSTRAFCLSWTLTRNTKSVENIFCNL